MSGPWERYASAAPPAGPWAKFAPPAQGRSDATAAAFGQGATMGFGDEITAAARAALPEFSNWMMRGPALQRDSSIGGSPTPQTVSTAPDFQGRYDEELNKTRQQLKADEGAYPVLTTGANIAGNVATAALALPAGLTSVGPRLVGNVAKGAATGTGLGAATGFGQGEGGFENRVGSAIIPAAVGGVLGASIPLAGAVGRVAMESAPGRWLGREVVAPVARMLGGGGSRSLSAAAPDGGQSGLFAPIAERAENVAQTGAIDRLASALQRSRMDPARAQGRLNELGEGAMLADVDPQFLSIARMANTAPGETRSYAKNVLEGRDRQAGNRIVQAFEGGERPPTSFVLEQGMDANRRAVGTQAYGGMREAGLNVSGEMREMMQVPAVRDALAQIERQAAETGTRLQPVEIMHRVKQMLNDTAEAAFVSGRPINKADVRTLAGDWENAFWRANPAARQADTAYAQAASLPDYATAGRSFLAKGSTDRATGASAPALADLLTGANPQQVAAARAGATNAARETALEGTTPARALARRIDQSAPVQGKLGELYGPDRARAITQRASTEGTFAETSNELLRGSKTAEKLMEVGEEMGSAALRISPQGISARAIEKLGTMLQGLTKPNEAIRNEIGRAMLNPNSEESRRILAMAAALLRQRAAGQPIRAGLIEGAAAQAGGQ